MASELSAEVLRQLAEIEPSVDSFGLRLYPCSAQLRDGAVLTCVYLIDVASFARIWGTERPEGVPGGVWSVSPDQISSVVESPLRLPVRFANEIYQAGESGMGYFDFCLVFSRWCRRDYLVGNFVDFLEYPLWKRPRDVKRVILHRNKRKLRSTPRTWWCVYAQ